MENNAGGADGVPDIADVDGFVESDAEEEEPDAHAQNAQPVEVDIPPTLQWGVVSAQLQAWEYKSANKTAEGTLAALRAVASPELGMYQCVQKSFMCASIVKGGKNSIANGLVAIVVEETDTVRTATYLRENGFVACNMEVTEETVGNGVVVDADINLGVRMIDLYRAAGGQNTLVEIDLQIVRFDPKYEYKASISVNAAPDQVAQAWYNHKQTEEGKDDKLSYVTFAARQSVGSDTLSDVKMYVNTGTAKGKSRAVFGPLLFEETVTVYVEGPPRDGFDSAVAAASTSEEFGSVGCEVRHHSKPLTGVPSESSPEAVAMNNVLLICDSRWTIGSMPTRTDIVAGGMASTVMQLLETRAERSPAPFSASTDTQRTAPWLIIAGNCTKTAVSFTPSGVIAMTSQMCGAVPTQ